jgi:hypothetical protein
MAAAIRHRHTGVQRAVLRRGVEEMLAAGRAAIDGDIGRRLLAVERAAAGELDAAVGRRRAVIDAELRALTPASSR